MCRSQWAGYIGVTDLAAASERLFATGGKIRPPAEHAYFCMTLC